MKPKSVTRKKTTPKKTPKKNVAPKAIKPSSDAVKQTKAIKAPPKKAKTGAKTAKPVERTRQNKTRSTAIKKPVKVTPNLSKPVEPQQIEPTIATKRRKRTTKAQKEIAAIIDTVSVESETLDLTPKEEMFCREYICDSGMNATKAYQKAFPAASYTTARTGASKLIAKPYIKARINEMKRERAARLEVTPTKILAEMSKLSFYDPGAFFDDDGRIKPMSELEPDQRAVIAGLETFHKIVGDDNDGVATTTKLKLPDKKAGLEFLARFLKMLGDGTPAPDDFIGTILSQVKDGEMTARDAAYEIQMKGLPLPEVLKIELSKSTDAPEDENNKPITVEELERKAREALEEATRQRDHFVPQRQAEVKEIKDRLKGVDSFSDESM